MTAETILSSALALSIKDRTHIICQLIDSLDLSHNHRSDDGHDAHDEPYGEAFCQEMERRAAAIENGTAKTIPMEDVDARLQTTLGI